jgi:type IV secretion system protein VirB9
MKTKLIAFTLSLLISTSALASQSPRPLGDDSRIRHVMYDPNEIYEIKASFGYQTTIEFSDSENIQVASIGDSIAWQVIPVGNRLFLKPVEQNPKTNLTVITSKRAYYFRLSTVNPRLVSDMTYLVRFEYPSKSSPFISSGTFSNSKSPSEYNFNYKLKNDKKSGLTRAFDNGKFTYLLFKNLSDLPAIFWIDSNKRESLVNFRIEGPYVVIERVADQLLFRKGKIVGYLVNKAKSKS